MEKPLQVFCCYARKDQPFLLELKKQLIPLQRDGLIIVTTDIDIDPGEEWEQKVNQYLQSANILLLLVSSDFIASEYCYSKEMMQAMARHEHGEAHVIPIILRPVDWQTTPFGNLQPLPTGGKSIASWGQYGRDLAFTNIAMSIREIVEKIKSQPVFPLPVFQGYYQNNTLHQDSERSVESAHVDSTFSVSQLLTNPKEFYGRGYECMRLFDAVRKRQCVAVVGPFRIGKTWLLKYLELAAIKELGPQFRVIYFDASLPNCATQEGFILEILRKLGESYSLSNASYKRSDVWNRLIKALDNLHQRGQIVVLCIDEVEALYKEEFDLNFFSALRALVSTNDWLTVVTASRHFLYEITPHSVIASSPFFNIFWSLTLGPFNRKEAEQFIVTKAQQAGFTESEQAYLIKYAQTRPTHWYPLHLQLAGELLLSDKRFADEKDQNYYRPSDPVYWRELKKRLNQQIRTIEGNIKP